LNRPGARTTELALGLACRAMDRYRDVFVSGPAARRLSRPQPVRRTGFDRTVTVASVRHEAQDVVGLTLSSPDGAALPGWSPGAHVDLFLPSGRQRQYSLCGDPADRTHYRIAVRRLAGGRGGSLEVHETIRVGDVLAVRGPRNAFPMAGAHAYLFLAAGIGITPILAMVEAADAAGGDWCLVYLGRTRASMPFLSALARYGERVIIRCDDENGRSDVAQLLDVAPPRAAIYACGPSALLDAVQHEAGARDRGTEVHFERFSPPPVHGGAPLTVTLARTGASVAVAADESVLAAVRRTVPGVAYSCQQGFCGSCRTRVLAGRADGRPVADVLLCSTRGDGLVLDL